MSTARCPGPEVLLLAAHDLLDDDDDATRAHLAACDACASARDALASSLAAPALPFTADDVLPALKEKLAAQDAATPTVTIGVRLLCTYCKDGAATAETVYCAACLAPHHADCFGEHGRCAAPGCEGVQVVRTTAAPPARPRRRSWPLLGVGLLVGGGAVAALSSADAPGPTPGAPRVLRDPPPTAANTAPVMTTVVYPLEGVLDALARRSDEAASDSGWRVEAERRLETQQITMNFDETPIEEAVSFFQDITGLDIVLDPAASGPPRTVSARLRNVTLGAALRLVTDSAGLTWTLGDGVILISAPGARRVVEPRFPGWLPSAAPAAPDRSVLARRAREGALRAAIGALGPRAWDPPARVEVRDDALVVTQQDAGHAALRTWLESLGGLAVPHDLRGAWFAPASVAGEPGQERARAHLRELQARRVTLSFRDTPLVEVLSFLSGVTGGVPVRLHPATPGAQLATRVHLRLRDVALLDAVRHLTASVEGLVFDVDRDGLLLRPHDLPGLEWWLRERAREAAPDERDRELLASLARERLTVSGERRLGELIGFVQDRVGVNLVLDARVDPGRRVRPEAADLPLGEALEQALAPLDLGLLPLDGILRVVPRAEATLRPDLAGRLAELGRRAVEWPGPVVDLAAFATALERASGARVVLTERARAARPLRADAVATVDDALRAAGLQSALRHAWTWIPGEAPDTVEPALVLDSPHPLEPLHEAIALLGAASRWTDAPPSATAALEASRADLHAALRALAGAETPLAAALDAVHAAAAALRDVLDGHAALGAAPTEETRAQVAELLTAIIGAHQDLAAEELRFKRSEELHRSALATRAARQAAVTIEVERLNRDAAAASERLAAAEQAGGGPEAAQAREALARAQERQLALARELDDERRRLADEKDQALRERAREERDFRLQQARLSSVLALREDHLSKLGPALPAALRARAAARAALASGATWSQVFPAGARAWRLVTDAAALSRMGEALRVGAELTSTGDSIVAVDGMAVKDVVAALDALATRAGKTVEVTLEGGDGGRRDVTVGVRKPDR